MIRPLGIGATPAIVALFLYSLLPIVRNTHAGLAGIPAPLRESAAALGLPLSRPLRLVELPLAAGSILAGIKTAAVINIGTATLGALIGAGGYGEPILTGIRLDNFSLILEGAVPAALLALLVQAGFELVERRLLRPAPRLRAVRTDARRAITGPLKRPRCAGSTINPLVLRTGRRAGRRRCRAWPSGRWPTRSGRPWAT